VEPRHDERSGEAATWTDVKSGQAFRLSQSLKMADLLYGGMKKFETKSRGSALAS
jgi:hypothetical protein